MIEKWHFVCKTWYFCLFVSAWLLSKEWCNLLNLLWWSKTLLFYNRNLRTIRIQWGFIHIIIKIYRDVSLVSFGPRRLFQKLIQVLGVPCLRSQSQITLRCEILVQIRLLLIYANVPKFLACRFCTSKTSLLFKIIWSAVDHKIVANLVESCAAPIWQFIRSLVFAPAAAHLKSWLD